MKREHPAAAVQVGATDEHRRGLLPVVRRVWAPVGARPTAWVRRRYAWRSGYGCVRPSTGHSWWGLLPTVSAQAFGLALAEFARDEGIGPRRRAVLVLDQAGWHAARDLALPAGVPLAFLPAASPERQPAARLWALVEEPVANRAVADLGDLEGALADRCRALRADRQRVTAHTRFHWWPAERRGKHR